MSNIRTWYDFVLQQMAAESYLEGIDLGNNDLVKDRLNLGNNRPEYIVGEPQGNTRFTDSQADDFLDRFQIIDQLSDNPNGTSFLDNTGLPVSRKGTKVPLSTHRLAPSVRRERRSVGSRALESYLLQLAA